MKITYRYYESDQGLEEAQAKIYNEVLNRSPDSAFGEVTPEQIKQRFLTEKKDPLGVRYAFDEEGNPLAYIQTTISKNPPQTWIGYPWSVTKCPSEVKEELFSEMLEYSQLKYPKNEVVMGYFTATWDEQVSFAQSKGFELKDTAYFYKLYSQNITKNDSSEFKSRLATPEDADILIELCKADPNLSNAFPDDDGWNSYFKERVLPDGNTVLIFKDEQLVCAGAPLKGYLDDGIIIRFTGIRPNYKKTWKLLIQEIAVRCRENGWKEPLLFSSFTDKDQAKEIADEFSAELRDTQVLYTLSK